MKESEVMQRLLQVGKEEGRKLFEAYVGEAAREAILRVALEEVAALCGPRYKRGERETPCYRAGSASSPVYVKGKPEQLTRPRVRRREEDGGSVEVFLKTWKVAQDPQSWEDALMAATLCGVSTRDQQRLHAEELKGLSKSAINRLWQSKAKEVAEEMQTRDLSGRPVLGVMLDGVRLADGLWVIIAIGFYVDGTKDVLGFAVGGSENTEVCRDLMGKLHRRGLQTKPDLRLLAVLDGSDALKTALLEFFPDAVVQRCLVHKERNLRGYLPKKHWSELANLFKRLRRAQGREAAEAAREEVRVFLANKNQQARDSFEEAGEELIAFHCLEVPSTLNTTFLSTNCIENAIKNLRRHIGRVCRWRKETDQAKLWVGSGLTLAQKGFRRIRGYQDLSHLEQALRRKETKEAAA
jgi:transposase-like protein